MLDVAALPSWGVLALFAVASLMVLVLGTRITDMADRLADRTGLGEAVVGGLILGAATSLSGTVVSVSTALDGRASLAFANGIGGIAAQTAFLALADLLHRRANLEHSAAEATNLFQGALLTVLLSMPLMAFTTPEIAIFGVHPVSLVMVATYVLGAVTTKTVREAPMWRPVRTGDTRTDSPDEAQDRKGAFALGASFAVLVGLLGIAGWVIAESAVEITGRFGISETIVGALMTAVVTSMPELVTTIVAVRRGAMQLAVGGIIGGNTFDTLFLCLSDVAYREGSIYHAISGADLFWLATGLVMTGVLMLGLILREREGPLRIGTESLVLLVIYAGAVGMQIWTG